ncbi:hypothetical protein [Okibacterium fritillariae]|uniref:Uncharacterized protein n=1 Tax=Okibacterium fritillariae TaxID=123320 RepID=A0A1T5KXN6_9MICO|nr:hypothetical protein [Okibacterium fritillariae]SKC68451.1 hypothetical protein SAMN06309945_2632 [Okibacterium fritillariae]
MSDPVMFVCVVSAGLSIGVLLSITSAPRSDTLAQAAVFVLIFVAVLVMTWGGAGLIAPALFGVSAAIGSALIGGSRWKDNPLVAGQSYWQRVWTAFWHTGALRAAEKKKQHAHSGV